MGNDDGIDISDQYVDSGKIFRLIQERGIRGPNQ